MMMDTMDVDTPPPQFKLHSITLEFMLMLRQNT